MPRGKQDWTPGDSEYTELLEKADGGDIEIDEKAYREYRMTGGRASRDMVSREICEFIVRWCRAQNPIERYTQDGYAHAFQFPNAYLPSIARQLYVKVAWHDNNCRWEIVSCHE